MTVDHRSDFQFPSRKCAVVVLDNASERRDQVLLAIQSVPEARLDDPGPDSIMGNSVAVIGLEGSEASPGELAMIQRLRPLVAILCYSACAGAAELRSRCRVLLAGACDLLDSESQDFEQRIRKAVAELCRKELGRQAEADRLHQHMREVGAVGSSDAIRSVFRSVERVGPFSDLPVLITGETGTGKELVANAIRLQDRKRRDRAFVPVNCGAVSLELAGSDLFGHNKGAYTGATQSRLGLFRAADQGILFLDEVGELALPLQAVLLRVLQTGHVLALGDDREVAVDVRVISATNRDLRRMIAEGKFREDLFHRLNVTAIHIPPLRDRREDIAELVEHFLFLYRDFGGRVQIEASPDFLQALSSASLAGNVRQVENAVRHALVHRREENTVTIADLPDELLAEITSSAPLPAVSPEESASLDAGLMQILQQNDWRLRPSLQQLEDQLVQTALKASSGNQALAARRLGISARSIYNKLHRIP